MKAIFAGIIAATLFATANAQTPISSVNAAGYIKVTLQKGKFNFLQVPFNKFGGASYTLDEILGAGLPDGSSAYLWNQGNQSYDIHNFIEGLGWTPGASVARGQGFFVVADVSGAAASYDVFLYGEVPGATSAASTTKPLGAGFSAVGFPYPVSTTLLASGLTPATEDGDSVYVWNTPGQNYAIYNRLDIPGLEWNGDENVAIQPGSALFVRKANAGSYIAQVPYSWPNN